MSGAEIKGPETWKWGGAIASIVGDPLMKMCHTPFFNNRWRHDDLLQFQKMTSRPFTKVLQGEDTMAVYEDHKEMFTEFF